MAHSPLRTVAMAALQTIVRCMQCVCSPVSVAASIAVAKHLLAVLNRAALLVYSCLSMVVVAVAAVTGWCGAKELGAENTPGTSIYPSVTLPMDHQASLAVLDRSQKGG